MDVVVFGAGRFASMMWYLLTHDSAHRVVGFTADRAFCDGGTLHGLPVLPFDALESTFPPARVGMLMAVGAGDQDVNGVRSDRFLDARRRGYRFVTYVSSRALVWPDLIVGEGTVLMDGAKVNPFATIGENCVIGSGCHVSHHAVVGDHCYFAPHAVVAGSSRIGARCFLGTAAAVRDSVQVGERCLLAAGSVVTRDCEPDGVYMGVPARRREPRKP